MSIPGMRCNEACIRYIKELTTEIEAQKGLISDLECDVAFWKTKAERTTDLNTEYNLLLARNNVLIAKLDEAEDEVFRLHNPHTGEECVCVICKPIREAIGEQNE